MRNNNGSLPGHPGGVGARGDRRSTGIGGLGGSNAAGERPPVSRTRIRELLAAPEPTCDQARELERLADVLEGRARVVERAAFQARREAEALIQDAEGLHALAGAAAEKAAEKLRDCPPEGDAPPS